MLNFARPAFKKKTLAPVALSFPGESDRDVEIGGDLDGNFDGRSITVLEGASVSGALGAQTIIIHGIVRGTVRGSSITVRPTGLVEGELQYQTLSVDPGAQINARCVPA